MTLCTPTRLGSFRPLPFRTVTPPPSGLDPGARLRHELVALLRGGQAHVGPVALDGVPPGRVHERARGWTHSLYDLLWHLRMAQADILEFATSADYQDKDWPAAYWPERDAAAGDWDRQRAAFLADLDALADLARTADLTAELAWAPGYTPLRQILVAADHNAHHLGQVVALRRHLGLWPPA